jgi:hypothetical protein
VSTQTAVVGWKRMFVRSTGFGIGGGLTILLIGGLVLHLMDRQKAWDQKTLTATNPIADQIGIGTNGDRWIFVTADIHNASSRDVAFSKSAEIMQVQQQTGALDNTVFHLTRDFFIPAHETSSVTMEYALSCEKEKATHECFSRDFASYRQLVIFEPVHRYEVSFDMPRVLKSEF